MSTNRSTLIITGAGGWLGKGLVEEISKKDILEKFDKVLLCSYNPKEYNPKYISENLKLKKSTKLRWIFGDLNSEEFYKNLEKELNLNEKISVIYAASLIHAKFSNDFFKVNFNYLKKFIDNLKIYNLTKFIYISSNSPFGFNNNKDIFNENSIYNPIGNYGKSKKKAELFLLSKFNQNNLRIIRAPWFHGNFMPERQKLFLKKASFGDFPIIFPGLNKRSIVNTKDLAIASINLITRPSKNIIYWVCEEEPISMKAFVCLIQAAARKKGIKKRGKNKYKLFFLPPLTSTICCLIDRLLQKMGIYSKIIHVMGELGMNIEASSNLYRNEFKDHKFTNIYESIEKEIEEAFLN